MAVTRKGAGTRIYSELSHLSSDASSPEYSKFITPCIEKHPVSSKMRVFEYMFHRVGGTTRVAQKSNLSSVLSQNFPLLSGSHPPSQAPLGTGLVSSLSDEHNTSSAACAGNS